MVGTAQLSEEERELLLQFYRRLSFARVHEKAQAILLSSHGRSPYEISRITFRDEKTVREWVKAFHKERVASLFPRYHRNQNAAKLTREQKQAVAKVLASPPSAYGLPKQFWEVRSLKSCLRAEFGVVYESDRSYHLLFKLHRYSFHLPVRRNRRRDEDKFQEDCYRTKLPLPFLTHLFCGRYSIFSDERNYLNFTSSRKIRRTYSGSR